MAMMKKIVLLLACALVFSVFTGIFLIENCIALGNTIYVDDSNTGGPWNGTQEHPYQYIQDGIDATNSGDTVYVYSGTYNENVEISENITLIGQDKTTTTINGASSNKHTVKIYGSVSSYLNVVSITGFTIRNVVGSSNSWDGIYGEYIENCSITDCIVKDSDDGIKVKRLYYSIISENTIKENDAVGLYLISSNNNEIKTNTIQNNQKGIQIISSLNNDIYSNTIGDNSQYGIYVISQSLNNLLYLNVFADNGQNSQDIFTNYWSYNSQGNYWDDYNGYDNNSDGIGDNPYDIPGGDNQDEYPLGYFKEPEPPSGNQQPTAHLPSISPNPATYGETVMFSGSGSDSDGYIVGYNWRSSTDGQLNTQRAFSTSSLSAGTHVIYFKVKDNDGDWSSEKATTLSIIDVAPTAYIDSITPNPVTAGETVYFIGHGTDDGEITEWKWISSIDGVISSSKSFDSSVLSPGAHTIYFQVRDNDNEWSKQDTETLTINDDSSNHPPVANAGGPYSYYVNMEINIDGSDSYDDDGSIVEYLWDFGDGTTGTGKSQTYTYTAPGNYSIMLTVTDEHGGTSIDSTYATIAQSTNQSGSNEGLLGFEFELPFPLVIAFELIFIIAIIALFLFWIKRK